MNTWTKLTAAALMSAAMLGTGLTAKPLLPAPAGTEITAAAADEVIVGGLTFTVYDTYAVVSNGRSYGSTATTVKIPEKVSGVPVTGIGSGAFASCQKLREITIPDSVTSIGANAFRDCPGLRSITIPDSVASIGAGAFDDCSGLRSITIPDGVTDISMGLFRGCSSLKSVTLPDSVTTIGKVAFQDCKRLTDITIPDSVKSIGGSAFFWCVGLTDITIPDGMKSIGEMAFYSCTNLKSIMIPASVKKIGSEAFSNCPDLTVRGLAGSYAEQYAAENSLPFEQMTVIHSADVKLSKTDFAYTGSPVKIGSWITVTVNDRKLTYGTDFVTVYKNNVDVGYQTASVTVKGRGAYTGQITKKFTIKPAKPAAPILTTANGGIHVTWQRDANADGVLVRYSKDSTFSSCHNAVYMTKTETDLRKFTKPGETWYVKIYSFIVLPDGTKRGSWSDAVSIKVK